MNVAEILQVYRKTKNAFDCVPRQTPFEDFWFAGNDLIKAYTDANSINPADVNLFGSRRRWLKEAERWALNQPLIPGTEAHAALEAARKLETVKVNPNLVGWWFDAKGYRFAFDCGRDEAGQQLGLLTLAYKETAETSWKANYQYVFYLAESLAVDFWNTPQQEDENEVKHA